MVYNTWITLILKHIGRRAAKPSIMGIHSSKSSERRRLLHVMKTMLPAKQFHETLCLIWSNLTMNKTITDYSRVWFLLAYGEYRWNDNQYRVALVQVAGAVLGHVLVFDGLMLYVPYSRFHHQTYDREWFEMDGDCSGDCTLSNSVAALYCYMVEYTLEEQIFAWITILIWKRLKYDVSHCLFSRCYHSAIDKYKKQNHEI